VSLSVTDGVGVIAEQQQPEFNMKLLIWLHMIVEIAMSEVKLFHLDL
jgi:hypothetical protein